MICFSSGVPVHRVVQTMKFRVVGSKYIFPFSFPFPFPSCDCPFGYYMFLTSELSPGKFHFLLVVTEWTRYAWKIWAPQKKNIQLIIIILQNKSIIIIFTAYEINQEKEHSQLVNVLFSLCHSTTVGLWIGIAHLRSP